MTTWMSDEMSYKLSEFPWQVTQLGKVFLTKPVVNTPRRTLDFLASPQMSFMLGHLDYTNTPTKPTIVHTTIKFPTVLFSIIHLNGLEVCRPIKTTDSHQLTIHDSQPNLVRRNMSDVKALRFSMFIKLSHIVQHTNVLILKSILISNNLFHLQIQLLLRGCNTEMTHSVTFISMSLSSR